MSGAESAEEPGIVQRHRQGCVERLRGLEGPNLPLSTPTGMQLAPTSPECVEGKFSEVRGCRVLGSSGHCPRVRSVAKIFGPAKPLPLRVAIASPSNKLWSCHNARACG
jgi:hypothetical protein